MVWASERLMRSIGKQGQTDERRDRRAQDRHGELSGVIERVTFHNDDSGYCVLRMKACGQGRGGCASFRKSCYSAPVYPEYFM
jgi:hypothetical protein